MSYQGGQVPAYKYLSGTTSAAAIYTGRCIVHRVVVTESGAEAISVFDSLDVSGTTSAILKASIAEGSYEMGYLHATGLSVAGCGAGGPTATIVYTGLD
jgi:hypothetical protein